MPEITDELQYLINDRDWDCSQKNDAWEFIRDSIREHFERELSVDVDWLYARFGNPVAGMQARLGDNLWWRLTNNPSGDNQLFARWDDNSKTITLYIGDAEGWDDTYPDICTNPKRGDVLDLLRVTGGGE